MRRVLTVLVLVGALSGLPFGAMAADPVVDVGDNYYDPVTVTVPAGSTVVWEQSGYQPHTVTATDGSWDSHPDCGSNYEQCMLYGQRYQRTFAQPGTYEYFCRIHGTSMSGTVIVTEAGSSPSPSPSPSPLPTVTVSPSPTATVPVVTASPSPSPTAARPTEQPSSPQPSPSVVEPPPGTPSIAPSSPAPSASPSAAPSASEHASATESDSPLGTPIADDGARGRGGLIVALVGLFAVGLGAFGYWQLRAARREAGP